MIKRYIKYLCISLIVVLILIQIKTVLLNSKKQNEITDEEVKIYKVSIYDNPIVPNGFKKVETEDASWELDDNGKPKGWNKGLVIEDDIGNQFVWVPVLDEYEQQEYLISDNAEEIQIFKYGGFYVGRFECGIPEEYIENISPNTIKTNYIPPSINTDIPTSKRNQIPWNYIDHKQAREKAINMYKDNEFVSSDLITENQWKKISEWLSKCGYNVENCSDFGNYSNVNFEFSGYYSIDRGETYKYGEKIKKQTYNMILSTGATERNKTNNIYDLAGNLAEFLVSNNYVMGGYYDNVGVFSLGNTSRISVALGNDRQGFRVCLNIL